MAKNILIISLLIIVLISLYLNYRRAKVINESKDVLIASLLSKLGLQSEMTNKNALAKSWSESLNGNQ